VLGEGREIRIDRADDAVILLLGRGDVTGVVERKRVKAWIVEDEVFEVAIGDGEAAWAPQRFAAGLPSWEEKQPGALVDWPAIGEPRGLDLLLGEAGAAALAFLALQDPRVKVAEQRVGDEAGILRSVRRAAFRKHGVIEQDVLRGAERAGRVLLVDLDLVDLVDVEINPVVGGIAGKGPCRNRRQ
jgi:hypothetical protein